jgi:predicted SAM-dependent methyltransferase
LEQESLSLKVGEKGMNNHTSAQVVQSQQNVINTFPEWWGHRESEPTIKQDRQSVVKEEEVASPVAENTSLWVNCKCRLKQVYLVINIACL